MKKSCLPVLLGMSIFGAAFLEVVAAPVDAKVSAAQVESLRAQVELLNAEAMVRMADDWIAAWHEKDAPVAVKAFAGSLNDEKKKALDALAVSNDVPAKALLKAHRRVMAKHPLMRDLKIISLRHSVNIRHARRDEHPAAPWLSCYNGLDAPKSLDTKIVELSDLSAENISERVLFDPTGKGSIHAMDLHWDAGKAAFSHVPEGTNVWRLYEADLETGEGKAVLPDSFYHEADDCCYLPDDRIVFTSDAAEQGLPCESGRWRMTNMYRLDPRSGKIERLTYDQDSNWYPSVLNDGRVQYVRWEYCDIPHYFSRIVMTMHPDGTRQMGFYGSNGYWPNHYGNPVAIPGDNGKFVCIATGHHAPKSGKIAIFDSNRSHTEAAGCVQMIPGWGKEVKDIVKDRLYVGEYPRFLYPYPLGSDPKVDGAGRYFLAAMKPSPNALWGIYFIDVFDNITLICETEGVEWMEPIARLPRNRPPVIPDKRRDNVGECVVYVGDVHEGPGLRGVPRGTITHVRLFAYHYGFNHAASHEGMGVESSWDAKYVLGTVPVNSNGSVFFKAPVNTPISIQPLDASGQAIQLMRSWLVGMPGEYVTCLGCHENANAVSSKVPNVRGLPETITPMAGLEKPRTWNFLREVQPILNRRCVGCHDKDPDPKMALKAPGYKGCKDAEGILIFGAEEQAPFLTTTKPNFADIRPTTLLYGNTSTNKEVKLFSGSGAFAKSYWFLQRYVRRPGPESDNHLFNPMEYSANTSPLVQMLKDGHHGVKLTDEEWRVIYTWIDLNAPFWGTWSDFVDWWCYGSGRNWGMRVSRPNVATRDEQRRKFKRSYELRRHGEQRYQGWWNPLGDPEQDTYAYKQAEEDLKSVKFEMPAPQPKTLEERPIETPFEVAEKHEARTIDIPGRKMRFRKVGKGIWFAETELALDAYLEFKSSHDNGFIDWIGKDHSNGGAPLYSPAMPVVRVSFNEAQEYCKWASEKTGVKLRLPTAAEWECAARAGSVDDYMWGDDLNKAKGYVNLADKKMEYSKTYGQGFFYHLRDLDFVDDRCGISDVQDAIKSNAWGLRMMIGNVEEWTVGKNGEPVACGGAYDTPPKWAKFSRRVNGYKPWQRVHNVGIRLVIAE